jgi:Ner family transcriptional regulator
MSLSVEARLRQQIDIKNRLHMAGYALTDVDKLHKLPANSAHRTLYEPNVRAEKAIARVLGVKPHTLWKERYDQDTGKRLSPQPRENYERLPSVAQRRNGIDQSSAIKRTARTPVKAANDKAPKSPNKRVAGARRKSTQSRNTKSRKVAS